MHASKTVMFLLLFLSLVIPIQADNSATDGKPITLTINWMDDTPENRPSSLTIELIRTLDGVVYPMDSKTLTSSDATSENTWFTTFTYYYGEDWEYSFKVTRVEPETALYQYQLIETGNGTSEYTFDYIYGHGTTEMTIVTHFNDIEEQALPQSLAVDLYSLKDTNNAERRLLLTGKGSSWSAEVTGLKDNPDNYYMVLVDLPANLTNVVSKGDSPNVYINTITENRGVTSSEDQNVSQGVSGLIYSVTPKQLNNYSGVLHSLAFNIGLLACIGLLSLLAIRKHRNLIKSKKNKNEKGRN